MDDKALSIIAGKFIAKRRSDIFKVLYSPEKLDHQNKRVELIGEGKETYYAIEHTRIESFDKQIYDSVKFGEIFGPLEEELKGKLPSPGYYCLSINIHEAMKLKNYEQVRRIISRWIKKNAGILKLNPSKNSDSNAITEKPKGLDFDVTLTRLGDISTIEGKFFVSRKKPPNLDELRRSRIREALNKKCPKLNDEKIRKSNCLSILVLETNDMGLGHIPKISKDVITEIHNRTNDIPDYIVLLDTCSEKIFIRLIKDEDVEFPNVMNGFKMIEGHDV